MSVAHSHNFEHLISLKLSCPNFICNYLRLNSKTFVLVNNNMDNCKTANRPLNPHLASRRTFLTLILNCIFFHSGLIEPILS